MALQPGNMLGTLYDAAKSGVVPRLEPLTSYRWPWQRRRLHNEYALLTKALEQNETLMKAFQAQKEGLERDKDDPRAELQGSVVNATMQAWGMYDSANQVRDPTTVSFDVLRMMAHHCEPAASIINTRVQQVQAYCQVPDIRRGMVRRPGFQIKMRIKKQKPTQADMVAMERLQLFFLDCGTTDPPRDERSVNWQPGFASFMAKIVRDRLTLDHVAVRRWRARSQDDPLGRWPITAFEAIDAGKIRKIRRPFLRLQGGVVITGDFEGYRTNTSREIHTVKVNDDGAGSTWSDEFTRFEVFTANSGATTDESRNGYGYGELERCMNAITIWINSRDYNASRFEKDTLPRGLLLILGNISPQQYENFKLQWMGATDSGGRWANPVLQGMPQPGAGVTWLPIDNTSRDMEYHQFMFAVALWMHSMFSIHPEETGYQSLSPFRPPLSEASPETKIKTSQDNGLDPLMRWLAQLMNREILWVLDPSRRYEFQWVGLEEGDEAADVELWGKMLQYGMTTPRRCLEERDEVVPEMLEDDVAMDMLGMWAANHALMLQMDQAKQQQQMQEEQQAQAAQAQQHDMQMNKLSQFQAASQQADQMPGGQKPPGSGGPSIPGGSHEVEQEMPEPLQKALGTPWI